MPKKLVALALSLLLPALAPAGDLNPGALQLSGKSAFDWNKKMVDDDAGTPDSTRIGADLSAMYFVSHFLAFGLSVGYTHEAVDEDYRSEFLFGPKAGIDWEVMDHLSLFADLTVGIARGETKLLGAVDTGDSVYNLVLAKGWLTRQDLDNLLRPETMIQPARHGQPR